MTKAKKVARPVEPATQDPPPTEQMAFDPIKAEFTDIGQCQALPLAPLDSGFDVQTYAVFAPRTIQRFKDVDGTTMVIVAVSGALYKAPAQPKDQKDGNPQAQ